MQKQNFSQGGFMPKNRQHNRKTKYPDKVTKPKCLVLVRIFLFCSVGIKIQYFPTAPFLIRDHKLAIGLEPTTYSLRMSCTTNCATQAYLDNINKGRVKLFLLMTNPGIEPGFVP